MEEGSKEYPQEGKGELEFVIEIFDSGKYCKS
jgi:hypothetical protein